MIKQIITFYFLFCLLPIVSIFSPVYKKLAPESLLHPYIHIHMHIYIYSNPDLGLIKTFNLQRKIAKNMQKIGGIAVWLADSECFELVKRVLNVESGPNRPKTDQKRIEILKKMILLISFQRPQDFPNLRHDRFLIFWSRSHPKIHKCCSRCGNDFRDFLAIFVAANYVSILAGLVWANYT